MCDNNILISSPKITEHVTIDVKATENLSQLTYQVLEKGNVIVSETIQVNNTKDFQFDFQPTMAMIPKAKVIVFYITSGGEIISDTLTVNFGNELGNFVSFSML